MSRISQIVDQLAPGHTRILKPASESTEDAVLFDGTERDEIHERSDILINWEHPESHSGFRRIDIISVTKL